MRSVLPALSICFFVTVAFAEAPAQLSPEEVKDGFTMIFNGKDLSGWKHSGNWTVEDGVITRQGKGGSLVYQESKVHKAQ